MKIEFDQNSPYEVASAAADVLAACVKKGVVVHRGFDAWKVTPVNNGIGHFIVNDDGTIVTYPTVEAPLPG